VDSAGSSIHENTPQAAGLLRRILSLLYESILLFAVWWAAGSLFVAATHGMSPPWMRAAFQIYLLGIALAYFAWCWLRGGQTLAMKTWRIRVVAKDGTPITKEPLDRYYAGATLAFRDDMREARRSEWLTPFASRTTKRIARKAPRTRSRVAWCGKGRKLPQETA
jgi:hypothetical protein